MCIRAGNRGAQPRDHGQLTIAGKWIIIGLMFIGRVGPVILGMAFFRVRDDHEPAPVEDVAT